MQENIARDKNSNLLRKFVDYGHFFIGLAHENQCYKTFYICIFRRLVIS
jgi:hypothetical protein